MQRLRSGWAALFGGVLLLTLTVSTAFGAKPAPDELNRGQTISAFVHELVFGPDDESPEEPNEPEESEEPDQSAEPEESTEPEESAEPEESTEPEESEEAAESTEPEESEEAEEADADEESADAGSHGACVSEAAHDWEGFEASEHRNHGGWVSEHARYICWGLEPPDDESDEDADTEEEAEGAAEEAEESAEEADHRGNGHDKQDERQGRGKPPWAGGNGRGGGNR